MINVKVSVTNVMYVKKICLEPCYMSRSCENGKCLGSITDDSTIRCDEIIESYNEEINFNEKKATCKVQNLYILLAFLLITIALLIAVSIYCYLIKYCAKYLLPFQNTNNKFKEIMY